MKTITIIFSFVAIFIISCNQNSSQKEKTTSETALNKMTFTGVWSRQFPLGEGEDSLATVIYSITEDSIKYEMQGILPVKYAIEKDTFVKKDNRWLGHLSNTKYVIFVKENQGKSITLFKKQIKSFPEGLDMPFPADTAKSHFAGWNTYFIEHAPR